MASETLACNDTFPDVRSHKDGDPLELVAFHGSKHQFDWFRDSEKENSPGVWFSTNRDYVRCMGRYIYTCRISVHKAIVANEDGGMLSAANAKECGIGAQLMIMDEPGHLLIPEAYVIVADPSDIEILEVHDKELGFDVFTPLPEPALEMGGMSL